jgi:hypothetical protein
MMKFTAAILALLAAAPDAKDDVKAAARKLAEQSYAWVSTPRGEGREGRFQPGPVEGRIEKDGPAVLAIKQGDATVEAVVKGSKVAVKTSEGWKTEEELRRAGGGAERRRDAAAFVARRLAGFKSPAALAETLADKAKELKDEGEGAYTGELSEEVARDLLSTGRRGAQNPPAVSGARGTVRFWLKEGMPVKYEYTLQGRMTFGQREVDVHRTTVVEIKDVGTAKVEVPEEARAKLP